jgi:hypothetical protein
MLGDKNPVLSCCLGKEYNKLEEAEWKIADRVPEGFFVSAYTL